jgi:hypothetical protein
MSFKIVKFKNGFRLCKLKEPNKCFSNKPMTKKQVEKQMKAIAINENKIEGSGKFKPLNEELYNKIKNEVYKRNPKHSLYRSALIQKIYQSEGGKYLNNKLPKMNIKKWFKQDWISLNDYLRGEKISCGNSNTQEKYNEYPLCRPFEIAKKLSKNEIKEMIKEKNILKNKPLKTEKVINRKDINIKPTMSGLGSNKFINQLNKLNIKPDEYLKIAKSTAKQAGYNPDLLKFSLSKKLNYNGVDFGAPNYNDFIIYKLTNPEIANNKRDNYRARSKKVMEETKNKYSPASLSYYILW